MVWEIRISDSALPDLARFDDVQQAVDELLDWAAEGPPCDNLEAVGPAVVYGHTLRSGVRVQYFIGTSPHAYVAILRMRRPVVRSPD